MASESAASPRAAQPAEDAAGAHGSVTLLSFACVPPRVARLCPTLIRSRVLGSELEMSEIR